MRKRTIRGIFQRGNRSANVNAVTDSGGGDNIGANINIGAGVTNSSADINNSGADINNSDADINNSGADNSTGGDTGTENVVCRNQTVDEQLPPKIQTPGGQLTHTSDGRLAQFRLQGVTRRTNPASGSQSRVFASHSNTNCSRIAGGSTSQ